jgi:hypothetical protein
MQVQLEHTKSFYVPMQTHIQVGRLLNTFTSAPAHIHLCFKQRWYYLMKFTLLLLMKTVYSLVQEEQFLKNFRFVSKASDAKDDSGNSTITINKFLENKSRYIYWMSHPATVNCRWSGKYLAWGSSCK